MYCGDKPRLSSPTSSTSTVDQQEILIEDHQKPRPKLNGQHSQQQVAPWKSLQHHFMKHSDVKQRPEKRVSIADYGNDILHHKSGWKVHHVLNQLNGLIESKNANKEKLDALMDIFVNDGLHKLSRVVHNCQNLNDQYSMILKQQRSYGRNTFEPDLIVTKIDDVFKGNVQRTETMISHLEELQKLDEVYCNHSKYVVEVFGNNQKATRRRVRTQKAAAAAATGC